jgi:hypothetical protein
LQSSSIPSQTSGVAVRASHAAQPPSRWQTDLPKQVPDALGREQERERPTEMSVHSHVPAAGRHWAAGPASRAMRVQT